MKKAMAQTAAQFSGAPRIRPKTDAMWQERLKVLREWRRVSCKSRESRTRKIELTYHLRPMMSTANPQRKAPTDEFRIVDAEKRRTGR